MSDKKGSGEEKGRESRWRNWRRDMEKTDLAECKNELAGRLADYQDEGMSGRDELRNERIEIRLKKANMTEGKARRRDVKTRQEEEFVDDLGWEWLEGIGLDWQRFNCTSWQKSPTNFLIQFRQCTWMHRSSAADRTMPERHEEMGFQEAFYDVESEV